MRNMLIALWTATVFFLGGLMHEFDLSNNYAKTGDALCWVKEIKR